MRQRGNYFEEIEQIAATAVEGAGYGGGGFTEGTVQAMAAQFGFAVHRSRELPTAVRSLTDLRNRRIYIPQRDSISVRASRSVVLQTLGHFALEPSRAEELRRVPEAAGRGQLLCRCGADAGGISGSVPTTGQD